MNPARSLGPALVGGDFHDLWIHLTAPVLGALIAVAAAYILRGPGGDPTSHAAGSGLLTAVRARRLAREADQGTTSSPGSPSADGT